MGEIYIPEIGQSVRIAGDEPTPEEAQRILRVVSQLQGARNQPAPVDTRPQFTGPAAKLESALQTATFGTSDELQAGMGAVKDWVMGDTPRTAEGFGQAYQARHAPLQQAVNRMNEEKPGTSLGYGLVGALATGKGVADLARRAPLLSRAATKVPAPLLPPAVGAASGAAAGAGAGQPGQRLEGAKRGAMFGGATGVPFGAMSAITEPVQSRVGQQYDRSAQKIGQAMRRDNTTPAQARARLQRTPGAMPVDLAGSNTRQLAKTVTHIPSRGKDRLIRALRSRDNAQVTRLSAQLEKGLGGRGNYSHTFDDLVQHRREVYDDLFSRAEILDAQRPIKFNRTLQSLAERPAVKAGIESARRTAANQGKNYNFDDLENLPLDGWALIKEGTDDVVWGTGGGSKHVNEFGKIVTKEGVAIQDAAKALRTELGRQNPDYAAASRAYAGSTRAMEAMERGRKFASGDEVLRLRDLDAIEPEDMPFFRLGAIESYRAKINRGRVSHDKTIPFDSRADQKKLQQIFPTRKDYNDFRRATIAEVRQRRSLNALGGSDTAPNLEALSDSAAAEGVDAVGNMVTGNPMAALSSVLNAAKGRLRRLGMSEREADALGEFLSMQDPQRIEALLRYLESPASKLNPATIQSGIMAGQVGGTR